MLALGLPSRLKDRQSKILIVPSWVAAANVLRSLGCHTMRLMPVDTFPEDHSSVSPYDWLRAFTATLKQEIDPDLKDTTSLSGSSRDQDTSVGNCSCLKLWELTSLQEAAPLLLLLQSTRTTFRAIETDPPIVIAARRCDDTVLLV